MSISGILSSVGRVGVAVAGLAFIKDSCLYDVPAGHAAVIMDKLQGGCQEKTMKEGTHFMVPFIQSPNIIDLRSRPKVIESQTGTNDVQQVQIAMRVLSRPNEDGLTKIYQQYGGRKAFDDKVLPSIGNEVLKSVVAQYNAEELLSKREQVSREIDQKLRQRAKQFHMTVDDVSITHLMFGKEYATAIELKQVAQQDAERQEYVVAKNEQEKIASITRAEGEAEAAKIISEALLKSGDGLIEVRRIDAAKEIAETLARSRNVTYLPGGGSSGGSNMLLGLNTAGN